MHPLGNKYAMQKCKDLSGGLVWTNWVGYNIQVVIVSMLLNPCIWTDGWVMSNMFSKYGCFESNSIKQNT